MSAKRISHNLSTYRLAPLAGFVRVYSKAMNNIIGRLNDWRLERRIARLGAELRAACMAGDKAKARSIQTDWIAAIHSRSPGQVARMDAALRKRVGIA